MRPFQTLLVLAMVALALTVTPWASGSDAVWVEPRPGTVALTFDDGPDPRWTPVILSILDDHGAKATFFMVGWKVEAHPELAREVLRRGHSVQSHSYGHGALTGYGDESLRRDLSRSIEAIEAATGTTPTCLRPPWGITSSRVTAMAQSLGLAVVIWDRDSGDWDHGSAGALRRLAAGDRWGDGDVILAHDSLGYLWAPVLSEVIEAIRSRGLGLNIICLNLRTSGRLHSWFLVPL